MPPPYGNLTPILWELREGDTVTIRPRAKGVFTMDPGPPNQLLVATVSGPAEERNSGWKGETRRVNLIVERYIDEFEPTPDDTLVYACGHPGMIEDVKERMTAKGFRVQEERFWKQEYRAAAVWPLSPTPASPVRSPEKPPGYSTQGLSIMPWDSKSQVWTMPTDPGLPVRGLQQPNDPGNPPTALEAHRATAYNPVACGPPPFENGQRYPEVQFHDPLL